MELLQAIGYSGIEMKPLSPNDIEAELSYVSGPG